MAGISSVSSVGYYPQATTFTSQRSEYRGIEDFKPGIIDPERQEKARKRKRNFLIVGGLAIAAVAAWFFTKGKGKGVVEKLKDMFKTSADSVKDPAKEAVKTKAPKAKVNPSKTTVVARHSDLLPGEKLVMDKANGREAMRKARHNKKQIIEATRLREEAEAFTMKDLENYRKSLGKPATAEELAFIEKNNKPAVNTIGDIVETQGIKRAKDGNKVVLKKDPVVKPQPAVAAPVADKAARIADIEAKIAKADAQIAKYEGHPAMARYAKPHVTARQKLLQELEVLQGKAPAAAPKAPKTPKAPKVQPTAVNPNTKKAEIETAWAEFANAGKAPQAPVAPKVPTAAEIWAKAEAEAARVAQEEAEVLKQIA